MFENIYLEEYILSYNRVQEILNSLLQKYNDKLSYTCIGKTNFNYNINCYIIGTGKKSILLFGATHSNEIVTTYFLLDFLINMLEEYDNILDVINEYTFHFIPVLNVDGYIITSSNIVTNFNTFSDEEIEKISSKYLKIYNEDDKIAITGKKVDKLFYNVLNASLNNICDLRIRKSVAKILKNTGLNERVLNIWSANGLGIDQNSNSIHKFKEITNLRKKQKFANLRYNDIPVTIPSPMSYPGLYTFDRSPENKALYKYIKYLYNFRNLTNIFSYHSTGGEVYGMPSIKCNSKEKLERYKKAITVYCNNTLYKEVNDRYKYGVMDYYREVMEDAICLTIELSKLNANSIGPFSDLRLLKKEVKDNKRAVIEVININ